MRWNDERVTGLALALALAGCGSSRGNDDGLERPASNGGSMPVAQGSGDPPAIIGEPYTIGGQRFEPRDDNTFDEVGYANVAGPDRAGAQTAIGEALNPGAMTGAHRILPLPSYVEVTNLETGRTMLVRINDRGPMAKDRVIELSPAAADQLGIARGTPAAVRVRRVNPPEAEKGALRLGGNAPARLDTPPALLSALRRRLNETTTKPAGAVAMPVTPPRAAPAARPAPRPAPPRVVQTAEPEDGMQRAAARGESSGDDRFIIEGQGDRRTLPAPRPARAVSAPARPATPVAPAPVAAPRALYVQVASFGDETRARAVADRVGGKLEKAGEVWRVRLGPFADEASARRALGDVNAKGYRSARIFH